MKPARNKMWKLRDIKNHLQKSNSSSKLQEEIQNTHNHII